MLNILVCPVKEKNLKKYMYVYVHTHTHTHTHIYKRIHIFGLP